MKWLCLVAALFLFAGCGDVNWFPDSTTTTSGGTTGNATGPDAFQFTPKTATISEATGTVFSDAVKITGDNPNGWKITLSDSPTTVDSTVLIDGDYKLKDLNTVLTIKPGQTLAIAQVVPPTVKTGDKLTTTVTVGTTTTQFVTTIQ